jgi:Lrp/AsnC family transcriptional regulator, regulator for asnA, asnC and gidA
MSARQDPADAVEPTLSAVRLPDSSRLDETDRAIVGLLQHDGRMSYREIARQIGVAEGTVRVRASRLMRSGALTIVAIADPFRLGYRVLAFTLLNVVPDRQQPVIEALSRWDEITYISSCTGRADLYAQLVCRDHDHLWEVLYDRMPAVGGITGSETFMELKMHKVSYIYPRVEREER